MIVGWSDGHLAPCDEDHHPYSSLPSAPHLWGYTLPTELPSCPLCCPTSSALPLLQCRPSWTRLLCSGTTHLAPRSLPTCGEHCWLLGSRSCSGLLTVGSVACTCLFSLLATAILPTLPPGHPHSSHLPAESSVPLLWRRYVPPWVACAAPWRGWGWTPSALSACAARCCRRRGGAGGRRWRRCWA